jgi:hypothetical protein
MEREVVRIEVGPAGNDRVGYIATYQDGTHMTHLFAPSVAIQLAEHLILAVKEVQQSAGFSDSLKVDDSVKIKFN